MLGLKELKETEGKEGIGMVGLKGVEGKGTEENQGALGVGEGVLGMKELKGREC